MCDSYRIEVAHRSDAGRRAVNQERVAHFDTPVGYVVAVADDVNGQPIGRSPASLNPGDRLRIGMSEVLLEASSSVPGRHV